MDVVASQSLRNLISNLHNQGLTIFLTTHYLEEADLLCDRIVILVKGKIIKIGTPEELKRLTEERSVIEVTFTEDVRTLMEAFSDWVPETEVISLGAEKVRIYGGNPPGIFEKIFQFSIDTGIGLKSVNSIKPSLEDAFMKITGLNPIVMAVEKGGK